MPKLTAPKLQEILSVSHLSKHRGVFKAYRGFFYRHGHTAEKFFARIDEELTKAGIAHTMVDCGEQWTPFRGGDPVQKSSHFWATFTVTE